MSSTIAWTCGCFSRYSRTGRSRPVKERSAGSQYGLGRQRNVEDEVRVRRKSMLETKGLQPGWTICLRSRLATRLPIRPRSWWTFIALVSTTRSAISTMGASSRDSCSSASVRLIRSGGQRVLAPGFAEARQQHVFVGLQEDHLAGDAGLSHFLHQQWKSRDIGGVAGVRAERDMAECGVLLRQRFVHERLQQRDGNVVDAVVPGVLKCVEGDALSGPRKSAQDYQPHRFSPGRRPPFSGRLPVAAPRGAFA